jgi:hypothetical protein
VAGRPTAPPWSITEWVTVMAAAPEPGELAAEVERLVELCPEAVLARVHAHEGLAEALGVDRGWWFCGVVVGDPVRLGEVATRLRRAISRPPLASGPFRLVRLVD